MPITTLPPAPSRAEPSTFSDKGDALLGALAGFVTEANTLESTVNAAETNAIAQAVIATAQAVLAESSADIALASANYKGHWADQTGAANVPYAVSHLGNYWQLTENLADVTAKTPGTDAEWAVIFTKHTLVAKTSAYNILATDLTGLKTFTNNGAAAEINISLLAGAANYKVAFIVTDAQYLKVTANGTEKFRYQGEQGAAGGYIRSNTAGTIWMITWSGNDWVISSLGGILKYDE